MSRQNPAEMRFHHVGIVVNSIQEAIEKYSAILGAKKAKVQIDEMTYMTGKGEFEEFKYAFIPIAPGENNFIELVQPTSHGPTARYLAKHGEGLFHLAFESSNIVETIRRFEQAEIPQAGSTPTDEIISVFFHPKSMHGVLIQIIRKGTFDSSGRIDGDLTSKRT